MSRGVEGIVGTYFCFHQGDLLDFSLKDEETIVVQINTSLSQYGSHFSCIGCLVVDKVFAGIILISYTTNHNLRTWNNRKSRCDWQFMEGERVIITVDDIFKVD